MKWNYITRLTNDHGDGHRIFTEKGEHGIADGVACFEGGVYAALADNSGAWPHTADDGVLWLDPCRPLVLTTLGDGSGLTVRVPVVDEQGNACATFIDVAGANELLVLFPSWPIEYAAGLGPVVELIAMHLGPVWVRDRIRQLTPSPKHNLRGIVDTAVAS